MNSNVRSDNSQLARAVEILRGHVESARASYIRAAAYSFDPARLRCLRRELREAESVLAEAIAALEAAT